jgi:hypothetical protein
MALSNDFRNALEDRSGKLDVEHMMVNYTIEKYADSAAIPIIAEGMVVGCIALLEVRGYAAGLSSGARVAADAFARFIGYELEE